MAFETLGNIKGGKGDQGDQGDQGLPGPGAVSNDAANEALIRNATPTLMRVALNENFAATSAPMDIAASALTHPYSAPLGAYNWNASALRRYRANRALSQEAADVDGLCRVAIVGDSQAGGTGATPSTQAWPRILGDRMAAHEMTVAALGGIAVTYKETAQDSRYTLNDWVHAIASPATFFVTNMGASPLVYTSDTKGTVVEVAFNGTSTPFTVSVDGEAPATVTPSGLQRTEFFDVSGLPNTNHVVSVVSSGSTNTHIYWIAVRATEGIAVLNAGLGGSKAADWAQDDFYGGQQIVKDWNPHLVVVALGTNDIIAGRTKAQFKADLLTIVNAYLPASDVVLATPLSIGGYDLTAYREAIYEVATATGAPVFDIADRIGDYATAVANGMMTDAYHAKGRGYYDIGVGIAQLLLG